MNNYYAPGAGGGGGGGRGGGGGGGGGSTTSGHVSKRAVKHMKRTAAWIQRQHHSPSREYSPGRPSILPRRLAAVRTLAKKGNSSPIENTRRQTGVRTLAARRGRERSRQGRQGRQGQ
ncbi:hypothetical protein B0J15DRAFT_460427 [Fusarium solani]|uniref:Uncharacterized protein n=1 Tax=Fusarium solani TaxID=169388 RepID=A0A9P9RBG5_FUSSL|nr:uncharacterized protein B0J15DRAFT_460427 [Fusarium solani]KAH7272679.1 hypothetical protein B0J15DRAFT_460427 [Fusarium solani]